MPRGHPLNPTPEAVAWACSEVEQVPVEAWPVLGVPGASAETALVRLAGAQPILLGHSSLPDCIALLLQCSDLSVLPWHFRGVSDMSFCAQPAL